MEGHACATACAWKLKEIFVKFVLSYLYVGSRNRTHGSGHWTLGCYSEPFHRPFHVFGGNFCICMVRGRFSASFFSIWISSFPGTIVENFHLPILETIWSGMQEFILGFHRPICLSLASTIFSVNVVCFFFCFKNIYILFDFMCVCLNVCMFTHGQEPVKVGRECQLPWHWRLWAMLVLETKEGSSESTKCSLNNSAVSPASTLLFFKRTFWLYGEPSRCHMSFRTGFFPVSAANAVSGFCRNCIESVYCFCWCS